MLNPSWELTLSFQMIQFQILKPKKKKKKRAQNLQQQLHSTDSGI